MTQTLKNLKALKIVNSKLISTNHNNANSYEYSIFLNKEQENLRHRQLKKEF